ncbi:hypothetical protein BHE74_00015562 [Ensete ventricosum]|nr:hypothetical protein GW17_00045737 [Ensete ventricosum]RWW76354.1 hypothetical protein BHE74_00015562 [Ensete ventricosum]RZR94767.1 hypothetical protein BHM03_00023522 [Ensete ventricosum]
MKNQWNDIISLLPLQEFMSLIYIQGKFCVSAPCSIFYVDSLHTAWIFHRVLPKLLRFSICIELMVALTLAIP